MALLRVIKLCLLLSLLQISAAQITKYTIPSSVVIADNDTVLEKWTILESRLKTFFGSAVKSLLPGAMEASSSLNVSSSCMRDGLKLLSGLKKMKIWAFKFLDSSSKFMDGMLEYTTASFGHYGECVNTEVFDERRGKEDKLLFRGKYCLLDLSPYLPPKPKRIRWNKPLEAMKKFSEKDTIIAEQARIAQVLYYANWRLGLCLPSGCSDEDISGVLTQAADYLGIVMQISKCQVKEETKLTPLELAVMFLYSFAGIIVLIGTLTDMYYRRKGNYAENKPGVGIRILLSFSLISNFLKFTNTSASNDTFSCLNGIKVITMLWIILVHTYLFVFVYTHHELEEPFAMAQGTAIQLVPNGSLTVDTFFFISGMLLCYYFTKFYITGTRSFNVIMYMIHRLWRILPVYIFVLAFVFIQPLFGSGPVFHEVLDPYFKTCEKNWWTNLLFISNVYDVENICLLHCWYLSLDMQFYIAALVVLLPLKKWPKVGISLAVIFILASMIGSWATVYLYDLPPANLISTDVALVNKVLKYLYTRPQAHAATYCIGLLCGYFLAHYPKFKIPKVIQILGWCISFSTGLLLIYGLKKWNDGTEATFLESLFAASCTRTAWTLAVAWVVVCCRTGNGGFADYILSAKMWIPLGRLTFIAYLIHPSVILVFLANYQSEAHGGHRDLAWMYIGHVFITYMFSFGGTLLIEAPFISLEKIVLSSGKHGDLKDPKPSSEHPDDFKNNSPVAEHHVNGKHPLGNGNNNTNFDSRL